MARIRLGPTPAELALLGLLTDGPAHPYGLDARLREGASSTDVAFSSIYAALARLEKLGLVSSKPDEGERGKARRVYKLTTSGRETIRAAARTALATPALGARPNDLGIASLPMMSRTEALAAITEARRLIAEARAKKEETPEGYPDRAVALHRSLALAMEEKFYAEVEKMVQASHPERARR